MNDNQLLRYSRHIMLPEIDIKGQQALLNASVLILGAGGLGCQAALYLAGAGTGKLTVSDSDTVELSNLQRQIGHHTQDIGRPKNESLQQTLAAINPDITVVTRPKLTESQLIHEMKTADAVLDCTDNFTSRYLINSACIKTGTPLVSGTATGFKGQVSLFTACKGEPCYQCLYPDAESAGLTCSETGILSPIVGIIGSIQALETIKVLTDTGKTLAGKLLTFDGLTQQWQCFSIQPDPHCMTCASC